ALVEDRRQVVLEVARDEPRDEFFLVEIVGDLRVGEVREFVAILEIVDGDDVRLAAPVERMDQIGADEAGGAGDDDVHDDDDFLSACYNSRSSAPTRVVTNGTRGATAHSNSYPIVDAAFATSS